MIDRRLFLKNVAATAFVPNALLAADQRRLFSRLIDLDTQDFYQPDDRFKLVHFMTAQEIYEGCGSLLSMSAGIAQSADSLDRLKLVLVMPLLKDQSDPSSKENLLIAQSEGFQILTGRLKDVTHLAEQYPDSEFTMNWRGTVINHQLNVHFTNPNGDPLMSFGLGMDYSADISKIISGCDQAEEPLPACGFGNG